MRNYHKRQIFIGVILIALFSIKPVKAQITIGADTPPNDYSILQIENTARPAAGVRLPQILNSDKTTKLQPLVNAKKEEAKGLTIYNASTNKVEYWNGTEWIEIPITVPDIVSAENGIRANKTTNTATKTDTYKVGLGGSLKENTSLPLQNSIAFTQEAGAAFKVSSVNNSFVVTNNKVGMGTGAPTAKLHVAKTTTSVNGFRLRDGSQGDGKILITDASGNASWQPLLEYTTLEKRNVATSGSISASGTQIGQGGSITCTKGGWLIIAKCATKKTGSASDSYSWISLRAGSEVLAVAGVTPEKNDGNNFATPLIVFFKEFPVDTQVSLYASGPSGTEIKSEFDGSFQAIKIKLSK